MINNFLNRKQLAHNRALYKRYGIKKSIFSPIGKKDVEHIKGPLPWQDLPDAKQTLEADPTFLKFSPEMKAQVSQFVDDGYLILKGFLSPDQVEHINQEIESLLQEEVLDFNYTKVKIVESYKHSNAVNNLFFKNKELIELLDFLLGREIIPFHTINFIEGSEQKAHSDSIHMATAPEGFMIAAWAALEPTDLDNGPLFYYPGSHRLPYLSCLDYDSGNSKYLIGANSYRNYEDYISQIIVENNLEKKYFIAEEGDILIWHANLLHGGDAIRRKGRTRKSMVAHYFGKDALCFHEISQRPALLNLE